MIELTFKEFNKIVFDKYRGGENASDAYKKAGNKVVEKKAIEINDIGKIKIRCAQILIGRNETGHITGEIIKGAKGTPIHDYDNQKRLPWFSIKDNDIVREGLICQLYSPQNSRDICGIIIEFTDQPILERRNKKLHEEIKDERLEFSHKELQKLFFNLYDDLGLADKNFTKDDFPYEQVLDEIERQVDKKIYRLPAKWRLITRENIARNWLKELTAKQYETAKAALGTLLLTLQKKCRNTSHNNKTTNIIEDCNRLFCLSRLAGLFAGCFVAEGRR
jgi:hypothetical protein